VLELNLGGVAKVLDGLASLTWAGLAIYIARLLRNSLVPAVSRLTGVEAWGVKFALDGGEKAMAEAFELAEKNPQWKVDATDLEREKSLGRAKKRRRVYEGAEILWVDDRPSNNRNESRMLRAFGALVTFACTTEEARRAIDTANIGARPFDVILSDISRNLPPPENRSAGLEMLATLRQDGTMLPVIFYVGILDWNAGVPRGSFGITNRPDILLTLVGDALVRIGHG
jgi:CheY-like chemotaxis protein